MGKIGERQMDEKLRIQRCEQYGSFLYCPFRDTLCFGRYTDQECKYDSCILDDPEYQELQKTIEQNRIKRNARSEEKQPEFIPPSRPKKRTAEDEAWEEILQKEELARKLYRKNKPKIADGLMADAMYLRRCLAAGGKQ